jgi:hypothetical protein
VVRCERGGVTRCSSLTPAGPRFLDGGHLQKAMSVEQMGKRSGCGGPSQPRTPSPAARFCLSCVSLSVSSGAHLV